MNTLVRISLSAVVLLAVGYCDAWGYLTVFTIRDANSVATFDVASPHGLGSWVVDGRQFIYEQWFYYRLGAEGPEQSISTLPIDVSNTSDSNHDGIDDTLFVRYLGQGFRIDLTFLLVGGQFGSGVSDMAETIRIANTGSSPLDFHFYQYVDFDILGGENDTVSIAGGNTATQTCGEAFVAETVVVPMPTHYQAALVPTLVASLTDGLPTTLDDDAGPKTGNACWGFEWDQTIVPGRTLLISKDKNIIPEPATLALMGGGLVALAAVRRKR